MLETLAAEYIAASFSVLEAENAIPTSKMHRHLQAHLDFDGSAIEAMPEFAALAQAVIKTGPEGLPASDTNPGPEHTLRLLLFSLLELCVHRCADVDDYDPASTEVSAVITEFCDVVGGSSYNLVVARVVSHLVPATGTEVDIAGITLVAETPTQDLRRCIVAAIPDADHAWKRRGPMLDRPPHSLLVVRDPVEGVGYHGSWNLEGVLDRLQLAVCLLTGANVQSVYQVSGVSSRISARPARVEFLTRDEEVPLVRRVARLDETHVPVLAELSALIDNVRSENGQEIWLSSFGEALTKFARLDDTSSHFDQIVQLSTALEGVILGANEGEGLTLRLCTRATALLAYDDEPAAELFEDLKRLYSFRSTIVHGGEMTTKQLRKDLRAMRCVPDESSGPGLLPRVGFAVDRLRDIVRRAILARLCLSSGDTPLWSIFSNEAPKLDIVLCDDSNRAQWRSHWRDVLASIGAETAGHRAAAPVHSLSDDDM
ncbi:MULTISPECIES: HEPN domain-containing protein [Nocardia]|uniref:HEPN domain-containing protein n=1 Tax=Nocardia TaxID=1817 RepID=UPI000BEF6353|nr:MULTISPECIES: HEPN domain-containing protein [Nocardia]MBF6185131.1 hypothetical protein [Nocardia farcinica]MBF6310967.1 hypothetical protein [Nocardia farcinica]MBF6407586.1 hypothetical protein [Nocardia farcinica]PEH77219.1 hypothetical protein CRM89_15535 [Nocardia sp. FDAARGOS_372]UEX21728.1 hypothetical protein LMJ57_22455 [Nocardia farcinica]